MSSVSLDRFKPWLRWIGNCLAVVAVLFVCFKLREYWNEIDHSRFSGFAWGLIALLAASYGAANAALAGAWAYLLKHFGAARTFRWATDAYAVSQLGKYIPGNIFHLAGRQAIGLAAGIPSWILVKSALWELILISLVGATFVIIALPLIVKGFSGVSAAVAFIATAAALVVIARHWISGSVSMALILYLLFLSLSGAVFAIMLAWFWMNPAVGGILWIQIIGAYVVAWLAGLLVPGAPAGVGVREAVLLLMMKQLVPEADLLLAVLSGRIVTVSGDLLFYIFRPRFRTS